MASVSTYLNFMGDTEAAFLFYRDVFGTEFRGPVLRNRDAWDPEQPGPPFTEEDLDRVMHVELPILGGHVLMGTDLLASMGHELTLGNNVTINLEPDTRAEVDRLYGALSVGGTDLVEPHDEFWGYWACCVDRFGVRWMFNGPLTDPG